MPALRHSFVLALLLGASAHASAATAAGDDLELFTATTAGTITVAPDGSVADVALEGRRLLGRSAIEGYENHIRTWKFEPVVENGTPVRAMAHLQLALIAAREKGSDSASYGVRHVWFLDPPKRGSGGEPTGASSGLQPPVYPMKAMQAGVGAEVLLRVELDADGRVARVDAEQVSLLGKIAGKRGGGMAAVLAAAAAKAAAGWRIDGYEAGQHVRVPVRFSMNHGGWERLHHIGWQPAPWIVVAASSQQGITDLAGSGAAPSPLVLLSKLPTVPGQDG
jgi:TonB family protein